jgi:hypothetical protein
MPWSSYASTLVCLSSRLAFSSPTGPTGPSRHGTADRAHPGRRPRGGRPSAYAARPPWMRCRTAAHGPAYVRLNAAGCANDNAPSADRIVCRGRAGEWVAPPRVSVSDSRQPTKREVEAAVIGGPATSQSGLSIRIASSQSNRRTWPAHCLLCQFGLARLVSAGRRADAPRSGRPPPGAISPDLHRTLSSSAERSRGVTQPIDPDASGGSCY